LAIIRSWFGVDFQRLNLGAEFEEAGAVAIIKAV
jgi:hypothetical protein